MISFRQNIIEMTFYVVFLAKSRRPFDPIPGTSNHFQMFIPGSNNDKFKDFVTERFKEILKYNQDNLQKRCLILDCECVPKECLKKLMKVICHTIDTTTVCIYKFEFCDTRLEMFYCMIEVIDTHFNNKKNYEFLEWKGTLTNILTSVLMRSNSTIKIYESVNTSDDKCVGFTVMCLFFFFLNESFFKELYIVR